MDECKGHLAQWHRLRVPASVILWNMLMTANYYKRKKKKTEQ